MITDSVPTLMVGMFILLAVINCIYFLKKFILLAVINCIYFLKKFIPKEWDNYHFNKSIAKEFNDDDNKKVAREIVQYITEKEGLEYACLIKGHWGCGKTYAAKVIISHVEKSTKKLYKLNAHGIRSTKELDQQLMDTYLGISNKLLLLCYGVFEKITACISIKERLCKQGSNCIIVVDNIERVSDSMSITDLFGYFEDMLHRGIKIIFIANEEKIESKTYWSVKEKTIGRTWCIKPEVEKLLDKVTSRNTNNKKILDNGKKYISEFKDVLKDTMDKLKSNPISLKESIDNLRLMNRLVDDYIDSANKEFSKLDYFKDSEKDRKIIMKQYCWLFFQKGEIQKELEGLKKESNYLSLVNKAMICTAKNKLSSLYEENDLLYDDHDLTTKQAFKSNMHWARVMLYVVFDKTIEIEDSIKRINWIYKYQTSNFMKLEKERRYLHLCSSITEAELRKMVEDTFKEFKDGEIKGEDNKVQWTDVVMFYQCLDWLEEKVLKEDVGKDRLEKIAKQIIQDNKMSNIQYEKADFMAIIAKDKPDDTVKAFIENLESFQNEHRGKKEYDSLDELYQDLNNTCKVTEKVAEIKLVDFLKEYHEGLIQDENKEASTMPLEVLNKIKNEQPNGSLFLKNLKKHLEKWLEGEKDKVMRYRIECYIKSLVR